VNESGCQSRGQSFEMFRMDILLSSSCAAQQRWDKLFGRRNSAGTLSFDQCLAWGTPLSPRKRRRRRHIYGALGLEIQCCSKLLNNIDSRCVSTCRELWPVPRSQVTVKGLRMKMRSDSDAYHGSAMTQCFSLRLICLSKPFMFRKTHKDTHFGRCCTF